VDQREGPGPRILNLGAAARRGRARGLSCGTNRVAETGAAGMKPKYFRSGRAFRAWLATHHATEMALIVGFHRVASGRGGLTYRDALDAALAYGWIDGIRGTVDAK